MADWLASSGGDYVPISLANARIHTLCCRFTHQDSGALISPTKTLDTMMPVMNEALAIFDTGGYLRMTVNSIIKKNNAGTSNIARARAVGVACDWALIFACAP